MSTEVPIQLLIAIIFLTLFLWWQLGSISVPIRLELTIIFATVLAITISAIFWVLFTGQPLNAIVLVTVFLILLGIGTDFDIYIYRRILEELEAGESVINSINTAVEKSGVAVVVSGLVMAVTFISLLASDIAFVRQFGLVTFVTILMDILLVRTLLVPAILMIFSPHIKEEE
jgi:RND superfamily putative drug exporter